MVRVFRRRRFSRRPRRTLRLRRRVFRPMKNLNKYDGVVKMKCIASQTIAVTANSGAIAVSWRSITAAAGFVTLADSPEFVLFNARFREYTVKYLNIKVLRSYDFGYAGDGGITPGHLQPLHTASSEVVPMAFNNMIRCPDYKAFTNYGKISRNYKIQRYFKSKNFDWVANTVDVSAANNMSTQLITDTVGIADGTSLYVVQASWYCMFRGPVI